MQTPPLTWQAFFLQLLLSLGPAVIALAATYITLRHQRKLKQDELSISSSLRARELIFNHYQKKLDRISAASDDLNKALAEMHALLQSPEPGDPVAISAKFMGSLVSIALMVKHEAEGIEDELNAFGLRQQYENELGVLNQLKSGFKWQPGGVFERQAEDLRNILLSLVIIQQAILEARMTDLFSEYLPARRMLSLNS